MAEAPPARYTAGTAARAVMLVLLKVMGAVADPTGVAPLPIRTGPEAPAPRIVLLSTVGATPEERIRMATPADAWRRLLLIPRKDDVVEDMSKTMADEDDARLKSSAFDTL